MRGALVGRQRELGVVEDLLSSFTAASAVLVLEGASGIGKTAVWQAGVDLASAADVHVLVARPGLADSVLSYQALTDLLAGVPAEHLTGLPAPQRRALEAVLYRSGAPDRAVDPRAVHAAFTTVLSQLVEQGPVLLAVDDAQWVDASSAAAVAHALRRVPRGLGVLATALAEAGSDPLPWLVLPDRDRLRRVVVGPMDEVSLSRLLAQHLGSALVRPQIARIERESGGNPFFALELARFVTESDHEPVEGGFPATLAQLVRARLDLLPLDARRVVVAVAAMADPTVELVELVVGPGASSGLLAAEQAGVLRMDGHHVRPTHPLLRAGAYALADAGERRAVHERLADGVVEPEERARHLALGALHLDRATEEALDHAARLARARGAPAEAAELLELSIRLGGDSPARRILVAQHQFDSGDPGAARRVLDSVLAEVSEGPVRAQALVALALVHLHDDSYDDAVVLLEEALTQPGSDPRLCARVLTQLLFVLVNLGRIRQAVALVDRTVAEAEGAGDDAVLAEALAGAVMVRFLSGDGLDAPMLARALALEDHDAGTSVMSWPTLVAGLVAAWTGLLDEASAALAEVRRRCLDRGAEADLLFAAFHAVNIECWRGDLAAARALVEDTQVRADQLGTDFPQAIALYTRAQVAAYAGDAETARESALAALALFERGGSMAVRVWPLVTLGFLAVSLERYDEAVELLGPLVQAAAAMGYGEPSAAPFAPDAAEALIALGRSDEAEPLVSLLLDNGHRLDRPWALAAGYRCRALRLAADGDVTEAIAAAEEAVVQHRHLANPIERGRTLLVLGQLQRRARQRRTAAATVAQALGLFEDVGAHAWMDRAGRELARCHAAGTGDLELTAAERRVVELAVTGLTNREMALKLFVSPKTVEATLAHVYRKLGVRSRAELVLRTQGPKP